MNFKWLYNHRKQNFQFIQYHRYQLKEDGSISSAIHANTSEIEAIKNMVALFFEPPKCPSCNTPFIHGGNCMAMTCTGRDGVICHADFCLWCMKVPNQVKILQIQQASKKDLHNACVRHVFECPEKSRKTPGAGPLFPTENPENSDWIVCWHNLRSIRLALHFLRSYVLPCTRSAVMELPEVSKLFQCATEVVKDRLKKCPQDAESLILPSISIDSDDGDGPVYRNHIDSDDEGDEHLVFGNAGERRPRVIDPPQDFHANINFIMESCNVNRRAATDALLFYDNDARLAILHLLRP
jgi:hypothetical protein